MKSYFSFFYPLLIVFLGFFFLFNTNIAYGAGTCKTILQGLDFPYCSGSTDMCKSKYLNKDCNGIGKVNTGDFCCTKKLEVEGQPGKNYDSCDGKLNTIETLTCGPGDCVTRSYQWYCCTAPTPTKLTLELSTQEG